MNIYVGNLAYSVTDDELRAAFARHGKVDSAEVIIDRRTGRSRGYGFVRMATEAEGAAAIAALDGMELQGRKLRVDVSTPKGQEGERRPATPPRRGRSEERGRPRSRVPEAITVPATPAPGGFMGFLRRLFG